MDRNPVLLCCHARALPGLRCKSNPEGIASSSPGLRGTSYPGSAGRKADNPNGVVATGARPPVPQPWPQPRWGCFPLVRLTQGNSFLATLGCTTQSPHDCSSAPTHPIPIFNQVCRGAQVVAKRLECGQLAAAFDSPGTAKSGSKLTALQTLRDMARPGKCCHGVENPDNLSGIPFLP